MSPVRGLLRREAQLLRLQAADAATPLAFYVLVVMLFAFGTRANDPALAGMAVSVVWVGALLAALLPLPRLFAAEHEDGTLEQWCLAETPLVLIVVAKLLAHWLLNGALLSLLAVPMAALLGLPWSAMQVLVPGLLLATAILTLLGGLAASLLVGVPRAGAILPLLILPLLTPVVIFGSAAARASTAGAPEWGPLYFVGALFALAATGLPWACASALRSAYD